MKEKLNKEEKTVLELLGQGETLKEIKSKLNVSMHRITTTRDCAMVKLSARNQPHAVYLALKHGLI